MLYVVRIYRTLKKRKKGINARRRERASESNSKKVKVFFHFEARACYNFADFDSRAHDLLLIVCCW